MVDDDGRTGWCGDSELGLVMMSLTIEYYPTHDAVTGLVTDDETGFSWYETVKMSGYYCDEDDCADEGECPYHPAGYWVQALEQAWLDNITARGMRVVE